MRAPTSTYRLQLHADFGFDAAALRRRFGDYIDAFKIPVA